MTMTDDLRSPRRFLLFRKEDVSGVSGTGVVAEGVEFSTGMVALMWLGEWPTSVVFHDRGIESVRVVHGHSGATKIIWLDTTDLVPPQSDYSGAWAELTGYVTAAHQEGVRLEPRDLLQYMRELRHRALEPIRKWMQSMEG